MDVRALVRTRKTSTMELFAKIVNSYNHGHNILRLFDTLPNFLFTTSEMKRDY